MANEDWLLERRGKFTCSRFGDLMWVKSWTKTALNYVYQVAAERCGSYQMPMTAKTLQWGLDNERLAIGAYTELTGQEVDYSPDTYRPWRNFAGGSPDGVVWEFDSVIGCVEVKCPYDPGVHMQNWHTREVPSQYEWQVHGHMLVTGASWCDFVSYDPRITNGTHHVAVIRVSRDEKKLDRLRERLAEAEAKVQEILAR